MIHFRDFFPDLPSLRDRFCTIQVRDDLRRTVLGNAMAAESVTIFKRVMWCNRRPRLLRVLAEELVELDRCVASSRSAVSGRGYHLDGVKAYLLFSLFFSLLVSGGTKTVLRSN